MRMARKKKTVKKVGPAGKYGARYGRKTRENIKAVLKEKGAKHPCPKCGKKSLKRDLAGVWKCRSCGTRFTGGAYKPETSMGQLARRAVLSQTPMIKEEEA